jgi:peptidoglycan/LPS O-acetylase OafA/YrhL
VNNKSEMPRLAYLFAICASTALAAAVVVVFLQLGPPPFVANTVPPIVCSLTALLFAFRWPQAGWRWGVLSSSGFVAFFTIVFISYLSLGKVDWLPAIRACSVLLGGVVGSILGSNISARSK